MFRAALMASLILMVLGGTAVAEDAQPAGSSASPSPSAGALIRPNKDLTPGKARTMKPDEACGHAKENRQVPNALRDRILTEYKLPPGTHPDYQIDHLIPLCLGGSNDPANLWPQPYRRKEEIWNAEAKDRLDRRICDMVCSGEIEIGAAQEALAIDWIAAYEKYYGERKRRHKPETAPSQSPSP
jgi:hypothetical protein